tara:strand:+ start:5 stop:1261 length:1257 start_codon:yes stop_codon:yes gene_type:complete
MTYNTIKSQEKHFEGMNKKKSKNTLPIVDSVAPTGIIKEEFIGTASSVPSRALPGRGDIPFPAPPAPINLNLQQYSQSDDALLDQINAVEQKFNQALHQYTTAYKTLSEEMLSNNNNPVLQEFSGRTITHNGVKYYVNSYGFAREYSDTTWNNRDTTTCSDPIAIPDDKFNQLLGGLPMNNGEPCDYAGQNITYSGGPTAFVDISSKKSQFDASIYNPGAGLDNRSKSCVSTPVQLSEVQYNAFNSTGSNINSNSITCQRLNVSSATITSLKQAEAAMNSAATEMDSLLNSEDTQLNGLTTQLQNVRNEIRNKLQEINNLTDNFGAQRIAVGQSQNAPTMNNLELNRNIEATTRDSQIILRMNYLKYLVGLIIVVLLVIFSFSVYSSDRQSVISIVILVLVIIGVLYNFWNYISRNFL